MNGMNIFYKSYFSVLFFVILMVPVLISCSQGDDVTAIRELIADGVQLAEQKNISDLMDLGTDSFVALPGELDKRTAKAHLWRMFRYYDQFNIMYPQPVVLLNKPGKATVSFPFLVLRKGQFKNSLKQFYEEPEKWLREAGKNADLYNLDLEMVKEGRSWKIHRAILDRIT